ncbi:hypothetical protein P6O23_07585 [Clostridium perfringens]|nr:hypothetical protein [Clostridium perfringens]MDM0459120.1 hypothetical protein [Clostridium perfringens]
MIKVGIKSVLIGFIVTACISLIYPIDQVNVLAGINVALIIAAFIAFFIDYKKNLEKENNNLIFKEEIKQILKDNSVLYEILKQLKDRKELDTISQELKNRAELNTIIENLKVLELNSKKEQIEVLEVIRDRRELEAIIKELRDRKELEDITRELKNRSELNELIKETKDFKNLSEKLKDEILMELKNKEKEEEIISVINKGIKTLKANDGENIVEIIEDLIKEVSQKFDDNKKTRERLIKDNFELIIENVEKVSGSAEQQLNEYKETTETVTKQLDGIVKESGVNVKLIKDSYSILNSLMEN